MKRDNPFSNPDHPGGGLIKPDPDILTGKSKMKVEDTTTADAGMDELLAVLGYKVRSTDMADVAEKLEQLAQVMGSVQEGGLSHLASETVHYNPSDLSTWLESMISELNPCSSNFVVQSPSSMSMSMSSSLVVDPFSDSDLKAIPGKAILTPQIPPSQQQQQQITSSDNSIISTTSSSSRISKRIKQNPYSPKLDNSSNNSGISRPVVVVDSQENGIRLVHTLMACAEAIQQENLALAEALVKQIGFLAASQAGSMRKVATYFAEGLARRIYKLSSNSPFDDNLSDTLEMNFYDAVPYLKFAHFTANQAILEAFAGKKKVHVIDFSMKQGMQWPALMQALAVRPEGPPIFRLTGIGPPSPDNSDRLQEVGWKLAQFADSIHIQFEYRGFVAKSLTDLESGLLDLKCESEFTAVNSVFEMHRLLGKPGSIEKVLGLIKNTNPVIFTVVEQEANHNGPVFLDRFNESLHYYSTLFDSLVSCVSVDCNDIDKAMSEVYLGRQICNVVACDGPDRYERHETLAQWRTRFGSCGFTPVHLGSNAFTQASMLLEYFAGGDGYGVEEREGCLMLGWHNRPLITTSAWRLGGNSETRG